jgi:hypothetical protein
MENRRSVALGKNSRHLAVHISGQIKKKLLRTQHYERRDVVSSETKLMDFKYSGTLLFYITCQDLRSATTQILRIIWKKT